MTGGGCAKGREMLRVLDPDGEEEPPAKKIEKTGSGPRNKGAMMIVREDGEDFTIGGGNIERNAILDAREMLASGKGNACIKEYEMEAGSSLGMACGGSAHILFTPLSPT